jgi:hypothetical protein
VTEEMKEELFNAIKHTLEKKTVVLEGGMLRAILGTKLVVKNVQVH